MIVGSCAAKCSFNHMTQRVFIIMTHRVSNLMPKGSKQTLSLTKVNAKEEYLYEGKIF